MKYRLQSWITDEFKKRWMNEQKDEWIQEKKEGWIQEKMDE